MRLDHKVERADGPSEWACPICGRVLLRLSFDQLCALDWQTDAGVKAAAVVHLCPSRWKRWRYRRRMKGWLW